MDCHDFERHLEALLAGELPAAMHGDALAHARSCAACGELLEPLGPEARALEPSEEPGLVDAVLAATVGSACRRCRELLCDRVDGELAEPERELADLHLVGCFECRALAGALAELTRDLPRLAEELPDAGFVGDVLAATLPWRLRMRRWWNARWPRWVRRPRFALEAAYVASLVIVLIFGVPSEPLAAAPARALEAARVETLSRWSRAVAFVDREAGELRAGVASSAAARWVGESAQAVAGTLAEGWSLARQAGGRLRTLWERAASLLVTEEDSSSKEKPDDTGT